MKQLTILRSNSLMPAQVRACAETLANHNAHSRFKWADPDPGTGRVPSFIATELFDVTNIGKVYVVDVWFHAASFDDYPIVNRIREVFSADCNIHWRELWNGYGKEVIDGDDIQDKFLVGCGHSHFGNYCGFDPDFKSTAGTDRMYRKELFERAINALELDRAITTFIDENGKLRMLAQPPLQLSHLSVQLDGTDPSGFNINGFKSAMTASEAALLLLSKMAQVVGTGMIRANLPIQMYLKTFRKLNDIARGWRMYITSEWDGPAARPLDTQDYLEKGKPGRYAAFNWWEDINGPEVIGSVLVEKDECYLELATEGGGAELLFQRAAVLEGVTFTKVLP